MSSQAGAKVGLVELPYSPISSATAGGLGRATASAFVMSMLNAMGAGLEWHPGDPPLDPAPGGWPPR